MNHPQEDEHNEGDRNGIQHNVMDGNNNGPTASESRSNTPSPPEEEKEDATMTITEGERQFALSLKRAVMDSNNEDLEGVKLTDMEYVQHAIVAQGNLKEALMRIGRTASFRRYYKIDHSLQQAEEALAGMMAQQPGFLLHLDVDPVSLDSINVIDLGRFQPRVATAVNSDDGTDNWRTWICGVYYMKYCSQPSIATVRNGFFALADFGDVNSSNFSVEAQHRLFEEVLTCYPFIWKHFLAYNTNLVANIKLTLAKQLMTHNMKKSVQLGCQIVENEEACNPTSRLRDFYLVPTPEDAQRNNLKRALELLEQRHKKEAKFTL